MNMSQLYYTDKEMCLLSSLAKIMRSQSEPETSVNSEGIQLLIILTLHQDM